MRDLLTRVELPPIKVDLPTYRRLEAMAQRIQAEDPTLELPEDFGHVVYAAICRGLNASERAPCSSEAAIERAADAISDVMRLYANADPEDADEVYREAAYAALQAALEAP